ARKLSDTFDVTVLLSAAALDFVDVPDNIEIVLLPALGSDPDNNVFDIYSSQELKDLIVARRDVMLQAFERLKPRVVAVENFPFTQRRLRGEVLPLIERAHNGVYGESLVVCITDGILVDELNKQELRADKTAALLDRYFDMVVVHSDPVFARIEEFFQPENTLHTPLYHTGFVIRESATTRRDNDLENTILVSAADGRHGGPLYRAAVEAHRILWSTLPLPMKIVAGRSLPEAEWQQLMTAADELPELTLERSVPDLRQEMTHARWSVSQCGYNTAVDALCARTPSLFVPCGNGQQQREQIVRAQRLVYWGAGRLLMPHHLNGASLANEIHALMRFQLRRLRFDLNGASNTAQLISQAVYHNDFSPLPIRPNMDDRRPH
ncbi:MAG: hypothetical protein OEO82_02540, partial [Gammaproteobacteria bacterium]|nr:hypothetical protein [Gammaproteobacteria bacterium]